MLDFPSALDLLAEATELAALGEEHVARQIARIEVLRATGQDSGHALARLRALEHNLVAWRECQTQVRWTIVLSRAPASPCP